MEPEHPAPATTGGYAVAFDKNYPSRRVMEDAHVVVDPLDTVDGHTYGLYCIFDGHGGRSAAQHAAKVFPDKVREVLRRPGETMEERMQDIFLEADQSIKDAGIDFPGCCALICLVDACDGQRTLHFANAGDSTGYVLTDAGAEAMSVEHNTKNPDEVARITNCGGMVFSGRVNGVIAVTRSLGDHHMKQWIVNEPYVKEHAVAPQDRYVLLSCDGLFESLDIDTVRSVVAQNKESLTVCTKALVQLAITKGSTDNITVILVQL